MSNFKTLKKFTDNIPNEDSCYADNDIIAISDGAGGCGVFASDWSKYLIDNIVKRINKPFITNVNQLDEWIGQIWEDFYNKHEEIAKSYGSTFLNKFYHEGAYATLAVVWKKDETSCHWITYGDSVVFYYNKSKSIFMHSFTKLADFANPPYLIGLQDCLEEKGFNSGDFNMEKDSVVFAATDALAHYIMMMYYVTHPDMFDSQIQDILKNHTLDAQMLSIAMNDNNVSFDMLIAKLQDISQNQESFEEFVKGLNKRGVLDIDDYTLAFLKYDNTLCSIP